MHVRGAPRLVLAFIAALAVGLSCAAQAKSRAEAPAPAIGQRECEALARHEFAGFKVTSAAFVPAGAFTVPSAGGQARQEAAPAFCRVSGRIRENIAFEVWLPPAGVWNGNFRGIGVGGFAGALDYAGMLEAVRGGYATASTDTGHVSSDMSWLGDPEKVTDFGYRAVHLMTVEAKNVIAAYYGRTQHYSYYTGCSNGARQGLMEATLYPDDYDGVVAPSTSPLVNRVLGNMMWAAQASLLKPESKLGSEQLDVLAKGAIAKCDMLDGVRDNIIGDPRQCRFDPRDVRCKRGQTAACLTAAQVVAARAIYHGRKDKAGDVIASGLAPGSESNWTALVAGPNPISFVDLTFKLSVMKNPNWDWRTADLDAIIKAYDSQTEPLYKYRTISLVPFQRRGGKLIIWHGWSDPVAPPRDTLFYVERLQKVARSEGLDPDAFMRVYMLPGVGHCGGGPGAYQWDAFAPLVNWVEQHQPPAGLIATHVENGAVTMSRPLCAFPASAYYKGKGDPNSAASFECRARR